jgi:DMSO/TMAO reductase YedYZ molybdopterin-dependent catalytic subunit
MRSRSTSVTARHRELSRRYFLKLGMGGIGFGGAVAGGLVSRSALAWESPAETAAKQTRFKSYLTPQDRFGDVSRGTPLPHSLPDDKKREVGLTRESWRLEVISDTDQPVKLRKPLLKSDGTALKFAGLMQLAEKHAVRFPKVMTCLNIGCPLGMGIWEGVPLREVVWKTQPRDDARRIFYYGYHNDDPKQMFRSSLPIGRVFEDLYGLPPVILCYKLNGQWLTSERGGPVRVVVPEAYGFKSIKWLSHVVVTSLAHANDTYAEQGNDVDSPLKTFAATLSVPRKIKANEPIPLTGYAQVGIGGLSKVQVWITPADASPPMNDPYFQTAPWRDMEILPAPKEWGGGLPFDKIPSPTYGFEPESGRPLSWPMRLCSAHWAGVHPGLPQGKYVLRSRAVDSTGNGQPLPRPFRRSGHAAIEETPITVG